jgi:hypothetical protein
VCRTLLGNDGTLAKEMAPGPGMLFILTCNRTESSPHRKKWDKGIECAWWISQKVTDDDPLPFKAFRSKGSFIVHLASTYAFLKPYTKGIYLTLKAWRKGRDAEGWKLPEVLPATKVDTEDEEFEDWKIEEEDESDKPVALEDEITEV